MFIPESDQHFAVDKFKNSTWKKPEDVTSIVALLDDPSCVVPQVKTEPLDQDARYVHQPNRTLILIIFPLQNTIDCLGRVMRSLLY